MFMFSHNVLIYIYIYQDQNHHTHIYIYIYKDLYVFKIVTFFRLVLRRHETRSFSITKIGICLFFLAAARRILHDRLRSFSATECRKWVYS